VPIELVLVGATGQVTSAYAFVAISVEEDYSALTASCPIALAWAAVVVQQCKRKPSA
jgi:hypothetical protein